jgi:hypothetical protein
MRKEVKVMYTTPEIIAVEVDAKQENGCGSGC